MVTCRLSNTEWGNQFLFVKRVSNYQNPGFTVYFPVNSQSDTDKTGYGYIDQTGNIYVKLWRDDASWVFNFMVIGT